MNYRDKVKKSKWDSLVIKIDTEMKIKSNQNVLILQEKHNPYSTCAFVWSWVKE